MCLNGDRASAFVIAAQELGHDIAALHKAVLYAEWCLDLDISEPAALLAIAETHGPSGKDILAKAIATVGA
jgi:2-hydroxychromene-2-carboxylate isomerase